MWRRRRAGPQTGPNELPSGEDQENRLSADIFPGEADFPNETEPSEERLHSRAFILKGLCSRLVCASISRANRRGPTPW